MSYDVRIYKAPESGGFGWHWEVSRTRESEDDWAMGCYQGYQFTRWGARRVTRRLARRLTRDRREEHFTIPRDGYLPVPVAGHPSGDSTPPADARRGSTPPAPGEHP